MAAGQPLLCLIDDAQWLDRASAQALAFVARRLDAESIAMLVGTRDPAAGSDLAGLPELAVGGLSDADARSLLASVLPGRLDERVRERIIAESGGNPLALLELPRGVPAAELAGGFGVAGPQPVAGRIEQSFLRRIAQLPRLTRRLLLLAAAEPVGDPALLWRAARKSGHRRGRRHSGREDRLLTIAVQVTFRHPLVRSALCPAAPAADRRRAPTRPSPGPSIRPQIRTAGLGTRPTRQPDPMRTSPPSSSDPPAGRRRAAAWPRRPPS